MNAVKKMIIQQISTLEDLNVLTDENKELKKELNELLFLISFSKKYNIKKKSIEDIYVLPESNTGYSEYRIINDCESDNKIYGQKFLLTKNIFG